MNAEVKPAEHRKEKEHTELSKERAGMFPNLSEEVDRWFNETFPRRFLYPMRWAWSGWPDLPTPFEGRVPRVDLLDRKNEIVLRAELPGVEKKDLDVSMGDHSVTIRASTHYEEEKEEGQYHRKEMSHGDFQRVVPLPEDIEAEKVRAKFKDGVLELKIPKSKQARRKTIEIQ